jgi:DNA-damage-inducible protein J
MATIQCKTGEATKAQAVAIFQQLGLTMSEAVNLFLHQVVLRGGLPFDVKLPRHNAETLAALGAMEKSKGRNVRGAEARAVIAALKEI